MKFLTITMMLLSTSTFANILERGVVSSAGGRVRPVVSCKTMGHSKYQINDLIIYNSSIGNPDSPKGIHALEFSLDSNSRLPSCEDDSFERFSKVVESTDGYRPYIDPRHRSRVSGFNLKFGSHLGDSFVQATLSSPSDSLPCSNLLPRNAEIQLICKVLD